MASRYSASKQYNGARRTTTPYRPAITPLSSPGSSLYHPSSMHSREPQQTPIERTNKRKRESWVDSISSFFADTVPGLSSILKKPEASTKKQRTPARVLFADTKTRDGANHVEETPKSVKWAHPEVHSEVVVDRYIRPSESPSSSEDSPSPSDGSRSGVQTTLSFENTDDDEDGNDDNEERREYYDVDADNESSEEAESDSQNSGHQEQDVDDPGGPGHASQQRGPARDEDKKSKDTTADLNSVYMSSSSRGTNKPNKDKANESSNNRPERSSRTNENSERAQYNGSQPIFSSHGGSESAAKRRQTPSETPSQRAKNNSEPEETVTGDNQTSDSTEQDPNKGRSIPASHDSLAFDNAEEEHGKGRQADTRGKENTNRNSAKSAVRISKPIRMRKNPITVVRRLLSKGHRPLPSDMNYHGLSQFGIPRKLTKRVPSWRKETNRGSAFDFVLRCDPEDWLPADNLSRSVLGGNMSRISQTRVSANRHSRRRTYYDDYDDGEVSFTVPQKLRRGGDFHQMPGNRTEHSTISSDALNGFSSSIYRRKEAPSSTMEKPLNVSQLGTSSISRSHLNGDSQLRSERRSEKRRSSISRKTSYLQSSRRRPRRSRLLSRRGNQGNDAQSTCSSQSARSGDLSSVETEFDNLNDDFGLAKMDAYGLKENVLSKLNAVAQSVNEFNAITVVRSAEKSVFRKNHSYLFQSTSPKNEVQHNGGESHPPSQVVRKQEELDMSLEFRFTGPQVLCNEEEQPRYKVEGGEDYLFSSPTTDVAPGRAGDYKFDLPRNSVEPAVKELDGIDTAEIFRFGEPQGLI